MERAGPAERETVESVEQVARTGLTAGDRASIQGFETEPGETALWHTRHGQSDLAREGELSFTLDGDEPTVGAGESFTIPGEEPHDAADWGDNIVRGVDVFAPPRPDLNRAR